MFKIDIFFWFNKDFLGLTLIEFELNYQSKPFFAMTSTT